MMHFRAKCILPIMPFLLLVFPVNAQEQPQPTVIKPSNHDISRRLDETKPQSEPAKSALTVESIALPELRYRLIEHFGGVWFCDPDSYPVARPGHERVVAAESFAAIVRDAPSFALMTKHLGLKGAAEFTDDQKTLLYREYKRLRGSIRLEPEGDKFKFALSVPARSSAPAKTNGNRIVGTVDQRGVVTVSEAVPVILNCPICLAEGTRIDTPAGQVDIEKLKPGMFAWTLAAQGNRVTARVLDVRAKPVPAGHLVIHLSFTDGRELWVSPGHPTADGRVVDQMRPGAAYYGGTIESSVLESYAGRRTYDVLLEGDTGFYWANGILLASSLR